MPWQTPEYYAAQRRALRPHTDQRLQENRWTTATSAFIDEAAWDACVDASLQPALDGDELGRVYTGLDIAVKSDSSAVVGVVWDGRDHLRLVFHRIFRLQRGRDSQHLRARSPAGG